MLYQEYKAHPLLAPYIKCIWVLETTAPLEPVGKERILPDGSMEMVFHYGDRFRQEVAGHTFQQPRSLLYGQIDRFIDLISPGRAAMIGVRFQPAGVYPFLPVSPLELRNICVDLRDIYGGDGRILEDRILHACNTDERLGIIQQFLLKKLNALQQSNPMISRICQDIAACQGRLEINAVLSSYRISTRHFQRQFSEVVGMNAKQFSRILRFHKSLKLMQAGGFDRLADLSDAAGYYDQAHFIRDFKAIAGLGPKAYFRLHHAFNEQFLSE